MNTVTIQTQQVMLKAINFQIWSLDWKCLNQP